jgi:hypothetical protein
VPNKKAPREPGVLTWTLSQRVGEHIFTMDGIYAFPSSKIEGVFTAEWAESQLNERSCFDFDYRPNEFDQLNIYLGQERTYEPVFLAFLFQNGQWQRELGHGSEYSRKWLAGGKVEFAEKTRLNTLRSYIFDELKKVERRYSPEWYYLTLTMLEVEAYDPVALESEPDLELLLEMMLEKSYNSFGKNRRPDSDFLKRFDIGFQRAGKKAKVLPTVPMRRPLGVKEWYDVWEAFQNELGKDQGEFVFDEKWIDEWKLQIAKAEVPLYQLDRFNHQFSYKLSSYWLPHMLQGDASFWTDAEFNWSLYCDGYGYFYTKGGFG